MKKIMSFAVCLLGLITAVAQQPVITFDKTSHDFGTILETDGKVTTVFTFKNEGMSPLVLSNVRASCGCTTPRWTREPVEPGQTGEIAVTYNPNGRPNRFQKTITVTSNATEGTTRLYISGNVIGKNASSSEAYTVKMGKLSLKRNTLDMGYIYKDSTSIQSLDIANFSDSAITIVCQSKAPYIIASGRVDSSTLTLPAKKTGKIYVKWMSDKSSTYGPMECKVYVCMNGDATLYEENVITVKADIREDFRGIKMEDAPIADMTRNIHIGTFAQGKKGKGEFHISNIGINPLIIRRIIANKKQMNVVAPKNIKSEKKGKVRIEIMPMQPGEYSSEVTIITNDPKSPYQTVNLHWTVEK